MKRFPLERIVTPFIALKALSGSMHSDSGYAWSWFSNLAMLARDAGADALDANIRAGDFMRNTFGYNIAEHPLFNDHMDSLRAQALAAEKTQNEKPEPQNLPPVL